MRHRRLHVARHRPRDAGRQRRAHKKLKYDPDAFEPVAVMASEPNVLVVRADLP